MNALFTATAARARPRCPETELEYFQRVANLRRREIRTRRRERRIARLRSLVQRPR